MFMESFEEEEEVVRIVVGSIVPEGRSKNDGLGREEVVAR